jgi:adenine-specific DNA-methyltransferase
VEVSKLSLFLALLDGESQLNLFHQRALPDLGRNLLCGNALIDTSFYDNEQMFLLDDEDRYRINAFNWKEHFPQAMKSGFDVVIGNPPYGYTIAAPEAAFFTSKYRHQDYQKDLYLLFLERYGSLLKEGGILGIIISNTWLQSVTFNNIRKYLASEYLWHRVLHLPEKVFDATVDTHVLIFERASLAKPSRSGTLRVDIRKAETIRPSHALPWTSIDKTGGPINVVHPVEHQKTIEHIRSVSVELLQLMNCFNGIKPFETGKGTPPQTPQVVTTKPYVHEGARPSKSWSPLLRGSLIRRYKVIWSEDYWIKYGQWLAAPRDPAIFSSPTKIMVRQTGDSIIAAMVPAGFYARNNMHILLPKSDRTNVPFVLALLNSKLMDFVYSYINPEKGEALAEVKMHHLEHLPIPNVPDDASPAKSLGKKAEQMSALVAKRATTTNEKETEVLSAEIKALTAQIDKAIYRLYELDDAQIKLIEEFASLQPEGAGKSD